MPSNDILSDLTIYSRQKSTSWYLPGVADLQVGWEVNRPGMMTFRVPLTQLQQLPPSANGTVLDVDVLSRGDTSGGTGYAVLFGKWVEYSHPTAGFWGGRITQVTHQDGIVTVGAEGYLSLWKGRRYFPVTQDDVGLRSHLMAAFSAIEGYEKTGLSLGVGTAAGATPGPDNGLIPDVSVQPTEGDFLDDILAQAIEEAEAARVSPYLGINMLNRIISVFAPVPTTSAVTLSMGNNVLSWSVTQDLWSGANAVRTKMRYIEKYKGKELKRVGTFVGEDARTRAQVGTVQRDRLEVRGLRNSSNAATNLAQNLAAEAAKDFLTFTIDVADVGDTFAALSVMPRQGPVLATLDLGPVTKGPTNAALPVVRVMARTLDVATGVMTLTAVQN